GYELPFMPEKWNVTPVYTAPPAPAVNASTDFEAWFVEKYKQPERLMKNGDGAYKFSGVQMAFSAWVDGRAAMLAQPVSQGYTLPEGWIACSERMPDDEQECLVQTHSGFRYVSFYDEHTGLFYDMPGGSQVAFVEHILVTHWMPLPAAPEGGNDHDTRR
ncbi:DUF551 domain-containing protein, partial [Serratia marcescens]|uniref:DUF551 domain-containing protein n=1 Tax=Serratia marcescens TaxID=615 RepID=UPI0025AA6E6D